MVFWAFAQSLILFFWGFWSAVEYQKDHIYKLIIVLWLFLKAYGSMKGELGSEVCLPIVLMHISIHFNQLQILSNWLNSSREFKFSSINLLKTTKTSMFCILFSAQSQVGHWVLSDWESWPRTSGDNFIFIAAIWRRTSFGTAVICIDELFHNSTETVNNKHC